MTICNRIVLAAGLSAMCSGLHGAHGVDEIFPSGSAVYASFAKGQNWPRGVLELSQDKRRGNITNH